MSMLSQNNKRKHVAIIVAMNAVAIFLFTSLSPAYWVWTPETKKFINPKNAVKDSPKEQFDWAMTFYNAKDYQRASFEFDKLTKQYEYSEFAAKAQFYVGLCYENMEKYYIAFQNYQKAVENFPHTDKLDEIIAREFNIGKIYASKESPKVLGTDIMTSLDRAIEIYKKVVDNAPYGNLADEAQFNMAEALKRSERYDEAITALQKLLDDYPTSRFVDRAQYELAFCAYKASLKPAYDAEPTDKAIKAFKEFSQSSKNDKLAEEAEKTIQRLKDRAAEKSMLTARFYESQKHYESAVIYYKDVLQRYPDSSFANEAKAKIEAIANRSQQKPDKGIFGIFSGEKKEGEKTEASKSKPWTPFKTAPKADAKKEEPKKSEDKGIFGIFGGSKKEPSDKTKKPWAPFKLKEAPAKTEATKEEPKKSEDKGFFGIFGGTKKESSEKSSEKTKSSWFSFGAAKKEDKALTVETPKEEPKKSENKGIFGLLFGSKSEAVKKTDEKPKSSWMPFKLDKEPAKAVKVSEEPKKVEAPIIVEEPKKIESVQQSVNEPVKTEAPAIEQKIEETKMEPSVVATTEPLVQERTEPVSDATTAVPSEQQTPAVEEKVQDKAAEAVQPQPVTESELLPKQRRSTLVGDNPVQKTDEESVGSGAYEDPYAGIEKDDE